ncbi:MAG TPA: HAMP domain-containing sensor histidine kinase, partial [Nakamurella sp.]|nr:HAMP domain-containing sensor histidine kinase [Nakamurella sp.]
MTTVDEPASPRPARIARTSLAVRVTLLVIVVAVLVAVISSVVGILVVRRTLLDAATEALADRADLVAAQLAAEPSSMATDLASTAAILGDQGITVVSVGPNGAVTGTDRRSVRAARQAGATAAVGGASVSGTATAGGQLELVEARSTAAGGFALVTPADVAGATRQALERRLLAAVLAGTVAAVLIGLLVARVVSAPLRRTANLARAMSQGSRDLRAAVTGPREVAAVSAAVNDLADALQHSESRQRKFLTSVSHELRTPLAGITGQAQALADGMIPDTEQRDVGRAILGESARLERLISDLLDLARLGADGFHLDLGPTDLAALVTEMAQVWEVRCAAKGVPFGRRCPARWRRGDDRLSPDTSGARWAGGERPPGAAARKAVGASGRLGARSGRRERRAAGPRRRARTGARGLPGGLRARRAARALPGAAARWRRIGARAGAQPGAAVGWLGGRLACPGRRSRHDDPAAAGGWCTVSARGPVQRCRVVTDRTIHPVTLDVGRA